MKPPGALALERWRYGVCPYDVKEKCYGWGFCWHLGDHWRPARKCDRCVRSRHQCQEDWIILCFANGWRVARSPCVTVLGWYRFPNMLIVPLDQRLANSLTNCWTGDTVQPLEESESVLSLFFNQSRRIRAAVVQICQASGPVPFQE